ncbi:MAG: flagellar hook-basal body complex protein FliE [Bacillota bacterium]|jgi:flagellar hook-basal body complex protein FliE
MAGIGQIHPISLVKPKGILDSKNPAVNGGVSFETILGQALSGVNDLQQQSAALEEKLASGQLQYIHQATALAEKATLALDLTLQIRNKALEAYQEIMRTQI